MEAVTVISDSASAVAALDPLRARVLAALVEEPASAAGLAPRLGVPRQKLRYHLETLAAHGLVVQVGERRHGGLTERIFAATSASYVVSPDALGPAGVEPARVTDRLSAAYVVAVAARVVREVGAALRSGRRVPTLCLDAELRLAPAGRAAFADDLAAVVRAVAARHHDATAADAESYRVVVAAHPRPKEQP